MDKPKIQMLLDIENIFGESTRGLGKFILTLCVALIPVLIIGYFVLYLFVPWQLLVIICLFWAVESFLIIMGDQKSRVENFKRQRADKCADADNMIRIRTIHPQGCVEYVNGEIMFLVVTYNDSSTDVVGKSKKIHRFINLLVGKHPFDICVQNITDTTELDNKYSNVTLFSDIEAANDFMEIIDFNREAVASSSTLTRNVICIRGYKYQWKEIMSDIDSALHSEASRVFRSCYLATDENEINEIISRDIDGYLDMVEKLGKKYQTGKTYGSKVISYDYEDKNDTSVETEEDLLAFIPHI